MHLKTAGRPTNTNIPGSNGSSHPGGMMEFSATIPNLYLGDFDDVGYVQVRCDRRQAFSDQVSLIRLLPVKTRVKDCVCDRKGWWWGCRTWLGGTDNQSPL